MMSVEKSDKGEITEKIKPQFAKSFAKITCRIQMRVPIPIEKADVLQSMGQFTLRDEGKTIALGRIIKYKPVKVVV
jgi:peptide chain release factor subunit 3